MALIHTKLNRPLVTDNFIPRPRLEDLLGEVLRKPLTLVSAPPGYGKSSMLSHQVQQYYCPVCWVSLDKSDNDLGLFLGYILTAIGKHFPKAVLETFELLKAPVMPPVSTLATSLINHLCQIEQPFVLVLDDYNNIQNQSVHDLLSELLRFPVPALHLVIATRHDPPLPLATYRSKGYMLEVGARELSFTTDEIATLLTEVFGYEVASSVATVWHEKTEGWITGLHFAILGLSPDVGQKRLLSAQLKDIQYVKEYFYNEVFSVQPPEIRHCLQFTAILNRFNAPLCEALILSDDWPELENLTGRKFISWLKKMNLFLIPLDTEKCWYRYHHLLEELLNDLLRRHYSSEQIARLHMQASCWFEENAFIEEALHHALAAGDSGRAVELVAKGGFQLMDEQQWPHLQHWLAMLPKEAVEQSPEILVLHAWVFQVQHNRLGTFACLDKIEALKATGQPKILAQFDQIKGHYETLMAFRFYMAADGQQALVHARMAIEALDRHQKRALPLAHVTALASHQMIGDLDTGLRIYQEAMQEPAIKDSHYQSMFMAFNCFVYWLEADSFSLQKTAERARALVNKKFLPENAAFANYFLGIAHYAVNDLAGAEEMLLKVVLEKHIPNSMIFAHSSFALALVYLARGNADKARECCEAVTSHAIDISNEVVLKFAQAFAVDLDLRQGNDKDVFRWVKHFRAKPFIPPYLFYLPQLTLVKALLAKNTTPSRQQAAELLDELHAFLETIHCKVFLLTVLALQALLHEVQEEHDVAREKLEQAIALAEAGGFIRPFLDLGAPMKEFLLCLEKQGELPDFARQLLTAFENNGPSPATELLASGNGYKPLLTNRELEVLSHVRQRLRDKEVAVQLNISVDTVKAHMKSIRKKLEVNSRMNAVQKAVDLNVLPPA